MNPVKPDWDKIYHTKTVELETYMMELEQEWQNGNVPVQSTEGGNPGVDSGTQQPDSGTTDGS